jgi:ATP-dependent helicase/nuclease subunit B
VVESIQYAVRYFDNFPERPLFWASIAMEIAGEKLSGEGKRQISRTASRVLINHIFRELKEKQELCYFGKLEAQSGIINALFQSIQDLRLAGIKSAVLNPDFFIEPKKGLEIQKILQQYEKELEDGKFFDIAQLYGAASEIASKTPSKTERFYLCFENQIFSNVEKNFLHSLAGKKLILVPQGDVLGVPRPRRLLPIDREYPKKGLPKPSTDLARAPWLFSLKEAPKPLKDKTLRMFQALGFTNECREVLRRIIKEKIPFDQVEIIHPPGSSYPSIFYVLAEKSGLPFSSAEGLPINFTIPGKVYSAVIDWMEAGYPCDLFCAFVENEYLKTSKVDKEDAISHLIVSRLLKEAKIGWGKNRYVQRLEALYSQKKQKAKKAEKNGDTETAKRYIESSRAVQRITGWLRSILDLFPSWGESEEIDLAGLSTGLSVFLKKFCRVKDELDGEALGRITSGLDEVSSFKNRTVPISDAMEWMKSMGGRQRVGYSGPMPGYIHLASFSSGGYSGRPYTFIIGLDQVSVPGSRLPDPILLDEEREAISAELAVTSERLRENRYLMNALLSSLRGQAVLSFSSYDVMEDRHISPSVPPPSRGG